MSLLPTWPTTSHDRIWESDCHVCDLLGDWQSVYVVLFVALLRGRVWIVNWNGISSTVNSSGMNSLKWFCSSCPFWDPDWHQSNSQRLVSSSWTRVRTYTPFEIHRPCREGGSGWTSILSSLFVVRDSDTICMRSVQSCVLLLLHCQSTMCIWKGASISMLEMQEIGRSDKTSRLLESLHQFSFYEMLFVWRSSQVRFRHFNRWH